MSSKSAPTDTIAFRLTEILRRLNEGKKLDPHALVTEFGVNLRTIQRAQAAICRIPDDCIDSKRYPLFMARDVMRVLIEQLQAEGATPS